MIKELFIIPAIESHRSAIVSLLQSANLPVADLPSSIANFILAVDGSRIVGVVGLEIYGEFGLLRSLAVEPAWRNQCIADKLIQQLEYQTRQLQLSAIYLLTETAEGYFERKGFHKTNRAEVPVMLRQSSEFLHVCPVSATIMTKIITA